MEKKRISIVINPQYMKANRVKIESEQAEPDKVYNRYDRDITRTLSLTNRPTTKYVGSKKAKVLHDKDCPYIKMINSKNVRIAEQFYMGEKLRYCKVCYRKAILRNGIKDIHNYNIYKEFFGKHKISTELLYELFVECEADASIKGDYVEICCNEDTWRIPLKSRDSEVDLKHNNYVRNFFGERYFGKGYHKQNIPDKTLTGALTYIMTYNYDKLHNPEKTAIKNITKILTEEFEKAFAERSTGYGNVRLEP